MTSLRWWVFLPILLFAHDFIVWQSLNAIFEIVHLGENNEVHTRNVSARDFFIKYRVTELKPNEVLKSILVPVGGELDFYQCYKQARRYADGHILS